MRTDEIVMALGEEKMRIDCAENDIIIFTIFQHLVLENKKCRSLIAAKMPEFIGPENTSDRVCPLSVLYIVCREDGVEKDTLADLAKFLNEFELLKEFDLVYTEDILEPLVESRLAFSPFEGTTNYAHCMSEIRILLDSMFVYLSTVAVVYRDVNKNLSSKEMGQSRIDGAYARIKEFAKRNDCEAMLKKLKRYEAGKL